MNKMFWRLVSIKVILLYTVFVYANVDNVDLNELKSQLPEGILPPEFGNASISVDDVRKLVREKCEKVAKNVSAYENIEEGGKKLIECIMAEFNTSSLQEEIERATPLGDVDVVFNKYCEKRPVVVKCIEQFKKVVDPCLEPEEVENSNVFVRIIKSLLEFACHKGGDQIALFIAEGGPECFEQNKDILQNCANKTMSSYMQNSPSIPSLDNLPQFVMGPKQCKEMDELQTCFVAALESCKDITPANIVDSMFRYIRNETSCPERSFSPKHTPHWISLSAIVIMVLFSKALIF